MISTRFVGLVIATVVCLTLVKWETVSGRFGGYLTNILLANILATECMIRMWWTGNLAVLRSYMKWAEIDATPDYPLQRFAPYEWHAKEREGEDNAASV